MYIKELTCNDYDGETYTTTLYFNLNEAELIDLEIDRGPKGIEGYLDKIQTAKDKGEAIRFVKEIIRKSYGIKSEDGRRFIKTDQIWEEFSQTAVYPALFSLLMTSEVELEAFMRGVVPKNVRQQMPVRKDASVAATKEIMIDPRQ